jgi:hypothetical protein
MLKALSDEGFGVEAWLADGIDLWELEGEKPHEWGWEDAL